MPGGQPVARCLLCCALGLAACKRPAAPAKAAPDAAAARFCDEDLTGLWVNASDRHFAYRFRDHGGTLRGEFLERADDGGVAAPGEPISFELHRTAESLSGVMRSPGAAPSGKACPVEFGIRVTACPPGAIQAVVETSAPINEACQRQTEPDGGEAAPTLAEFRFERAPDHPSGGGEAPDAH